MSKLRAARLFCICCSIAVLLGWVLLYPSAAPAQEKFKMTTTAEGVKSEYTKQHILEVGDMPGHRIRIHEIHRTYAPDDARRVKGFLPVERWEWNITDYVNWSGEHRGYGFTVYENGDKIYDQWEGTTHTTLLPEGGSKGEFWGLGITTGGTGVFKGIRGNSIYDGIWDRAKGLNEVNTEWEYWFE